MSSTEKPGCCPDGRIFPATTEPSSYAYKGSFSKVGNDLEVYKVGSGSKVIVMIADIFGLRSGRHLGICDQLAHNLSCTVVAPDVFRGDKYVPGQDDLQAWILKYPIVDVQKDLDVVYRDVIPADKYEKIALIGFCWGCWVNFHEGARLVDNRLICGINMHPSLRLEGFFGGDTKSLSDKNQIPQLCFPCKDDPDNIKPGPENVLSPNLCTIHPLNEVEHGFSSQGDVSDPVVLRNCQKAFDLTEEYLKAHL